MAAIQSSHTPNWALSLLLMHVNRVVNFIYKILWYMKQYLQTTIHLYCYNSTSAWF